MLFQEVKLHIVIFLNRNEEKNSGKTNEGLQIVILCLALLLSRDLDQVYFLCQLKNYNLRRIRSAAGISRKNISERITR